LAMSALAACSVLKPHYEYASEDMDVSRDYDKKQEMYLLGLVWALRDSGPKLPPYREASGPMGHGYYWVCHHALASQVKTSAWWAKGKPWHLTKGLTGKAWSQDLDATTRRVNSLVSRAASQLSVTDNWASWFRSEESFLGRELKKALPIVTATPLFPEREVRYMTARYQNAVAAYSCARKLLRSPVLEELPTLATTLKVAGQGLAPFTNLMDGLTTHRVNGVYPRNPRERKRAKKLPIKELIDSLPKEQFIWTFDPLVYGGKRPFVVPELFLEEPDPDWSRLRQTYQVGIDSVKRSGLNELADLASDWADEIFCPKSREA
jgi:hypothetical protein